MSAAYEELDCEIEPDFEDSTDVVLDFDFNLPSGGYEYKEWPEYHAYCKRVEARQQIQDDFVRHFVINAMSVFCFLRIPEILWWRKFGK
jgi:hypothetical protein